ncbi:MAG: DsbA family protein [Flavobacteriaceae bacterium]
MIQTTRRMMLQIAAMSIAALVMATGSTLAFTMEEMGVAGPLGDRTLGDPNAPVTIVEYASLTCPHCANFHETVYPKLKSEYIDTGKVYFIYRDFPLDGRAFGAAMLTRCVPEDKYFDMVGLLFDTQRKWAAAEPAQAEQALLDVVKQAGFTQESFYACLQKQDLVDGIQWVRQRAKDRFGVNSTPSVFINGELTEAFSFEDIAKEIDAAM